MSWTKTRSTWRKLLLTPTQIHFLPRILYFLTANHPTNPNFHIRTVWFLFLKVLRFITVFHSYCLLDLRRIRIAEYIELWEAERPHSCLVGLNARFYCCASLRPQPSFSLSAETAPLEEAAAAFTTAKNHGAPILKVSSTWQGYTELQINFKEFRSLWDKMTDKVKAALKVRMLEQFFTNLGIP